MRITQPRSQGLFPPRPPSQGKDPENEVGEEEEESPILFGGLNNLISCKNMHNHER